jgi:hypothetical protein
MKSETIRFGPRSERFDFRRVTTGVSYRVWKGKRWTSDPFTCCSVRSDRSRRAGIGCGPTRCSTAYIQEPIVCTQTVSWNREPVKVVREGMWQRENPHLVRPDKQHTCRLSVSMPRE